MAEALKLEPKGKIEMQTASGLVAVNTYEVNLAIILSTKSDEHGVIDAATNIFANLIVPEFDAGKNPYQALIGRNILRHGVLTLAFDGHYSFSY